MSSRPENECHGGGCGDGEEGESGDLKASGDAHYEKAIFFFFKVEEKRRLRIRCRYLEMRFREMRAHIIRQI